MSSNQVPQPLLAPLPSFPAHTKEHHHSVQFYSDDAFLLNSVSRFVGTALGGGDAAVVIATKAHRLGLEQKLRARGLDLTKALVQGRYVALDAAETLSRFMRNGSIDAARAHEVLGPVLRSAEAAASGDHGRVAAFGEMVAILWDEGNSEAAIELEQVWNELAGRHAFSLLCGYPITSFDRAQDIRPFLRICAEHSHVIPAETYSDLQNDAQRLLEIAHLQQQAASLKTIAEERQALAEALESEVKDLHDLHELASRPSLLDLRQTMRDALSAVVALQKGSMGLLSLRDAATGDLHVGASQGFSDEFLRAITRVPAGAGACGTCLARREHVIVEDVESDPLFEPYRDAARAAGFRAVHSTPLLAASGEVIGVLSVHFADPHRPTDREMRLTDLYARFTVNAIENGRLYHEAQIEIARRKTAEQALRESEEFLRNIVQSSADCIKVLDLSGAILYISPPGQRALGIKDASSVLNRLWVEFWPEDDQPKAAGALAEATAGRIGRFQGLLHDTAGSSKWWDVQLSPMLNKDGGVDRIIAISREITDIKHAHAALMQSEKFAAAGRLAATIAHEINNPLEAITNLFYLLNTHASLDDQARHYANLCEQELGRVSHIVKQTLGFYRAVATPTRVRVADIARNVLGLQRKSLERARVHVIEELWCTDEVFAYTGELRQVILNLVTNATDAMPAGGTLRVRVHASTDPRDNSRHGVRVTVADTGNGIRQEDRARLFQAFFSTKGEKGTGLGLWVTKSIVQKHEGSIRFRSRVGRHHGTAFSVFFPAEPSTIVPRTTRVTTAAIVKS